MTVEAIKTGVFKEKEKLLPFILKNVPNLEDGDVLVVTSKIAALSQGRTVSLKNKEKAIKRESSKTIKGEWCYLTLKNGEWCANAGVDESNASGKVILLPRDPKRVARGILKGLKDEFNVQRCGVILTDTRNIPLRRGSLGVALAWAGFEGLESYVGRKDIFGRKFKMTRANIADALASSAVLTMGEGDERKPLALIKGIKLKFNNRTYDHKLLSIRPEEDLYKPLYRH